MKDKFITDSLKQLEDLKKEYQTKGTNILKEAFKRFFEENKDVKHIEWTQYTSYWNDGEPCNFYVHEMYPISNEDNDCEDQKFEDEKKVFSMIKDLESIPNEIFLDMFGDHVFIEATKDGFKVSDYSDHG